MTSPLSRPSVLLNRVGEIWRRRDGQFVTITHTKPGKSNPYAAALPNNPAYHWYDTALRIGALDNDADLVELIYDPRAGAPEYLDPEYIDCALAPQPSPAPTAPLSSDVVATQSSGATKQCNQCAAWEQLTPHDTSSGRCLRRAPVPLDRDDLWAYWPTTSAHDHCFDFITKSRHQ